MDLTTEQRALLEGARTATLATIADDGTPRLVPVCFVVQAPPSARADAALTLWSPLDDKPKVVRDPRRLARVRDVLARPGVALLIHRWSEDWSELGWLRLHGEARLVEPSTTPPAIVAALRTKYPQYADHDLEGRPMLAVTLQGATSWGAGLEPSARVSAPGDAGPGTG